MLIVVGAPVACVVPEYGVEIETVAGAAGGKDSTGTVTVFGVTANEDGSEVVGPAVVGFTEKSTTVGFTSE